MASFSNPAAGAAGLRRLRKLARLALARLPAPDPVATLAAARRNACLTKPEGALGRLEELALWYAGWRGDPAPQVLRPQVVVFAGNHGIAGRGVSRWPASVTAQMVANFEAGGAAINQLAAQAGATLRVVPLELDRPVADFTTAPALTPAELERALKAGWRAVDPRADLLAFGEMGIGNSTAAAALAMALYGGAAPDWAGRGAGLDDAGLALKCALIARGIAAHPEVAGDPLAALGAFAGREMAAIAGAVLRARHLRIPVLLDGFIVTAAAAVLECAQAGALDHTRAAHVSAEPGHARLLSRLGQEPLLSLGLRLGEGSGAALAIPILKAALACHSGMASFAEAGVAGPVAGAPAAAAEPFAPPGLEQSGRPA